MNGLYRLIASTSRGSSYLPLTQALVTNSIETNTTYLDAINVFEEWIKTKSYFGDTLAAQLFLGSDSSKCAYDWLNGTYGTFAGGWTYDGKGAKGNGTNTDFEDGITADQLGADKGFFVLTNNFDSTTTAFDLGNGGNNRIMTAFGYGGGYTAYSRVNSAGYLVRSGQGTSLGTHLGYRNNSTQHKLIDVNEVLQTEADTNSTADSSLLYLGTGAAGSSDRQYGIFIKGSASLSDADAAELWTKVDDLNTIIHP